MLLQAMVVLAVLDYLSGIFAAAVEGKLSSKKGFKALPKKLLIFVMIAVAHMADKMINGESSIIMDATIFFYAANEVLSIIENCGRAGLPVPGALKKIIEVLQQKAGDGSGENGMKKNDGT